VKWKKEDLTDKIINACINVHKELGPGFLESIYHTALKIEFERQRLVHESEKEVKVKYLGYDVGVHRMPGKVVFKGTEQRCRLISKFC